MSEYDLINRTLTSAELDELTGTSKLLTYYVAHAMIDPGKGNEKRK